jgi:protein involved in polysaccharide export with SLBB domain
MGFGRMRTLLIGLLIGCALGCASQPGGPTTGTDMRSLPARSPNLSREPESTGMDYFGSANDLQRLQGLWEARSNATPFSDFLLGSGDQLAIIVPAIAALSDITVTVSSDGTINLPLLGRLQAGGLTESQVRQELNDRLAKYMYDPQFQFAVKQYQSREVAVLGSVSRPGVYTLIGPSETILQLIGLAGGPTDGASDRIVLIPADPGTSPGAKAESKSVGTSYEGESVPGATLPVSSFQSTEQVPLSATTLPIQRAPYFLGSNGNPIVVSLRSNSVIGSERYLNMPLRPGDLVVVPSGGSVAVTGWVNSPGSFKVAPGESVLSTIGAAGGLLFAANEDKVTLFRTAADGTTQSIPVNLDKIRSGQEPDIPVQGNDVIEVSYSKAKIVPYIFYQLFNSKVGGVGIAAPIP